MPVVSLDIWASVESPLFVNVTHYYIRFICFKFTKKNYVSLFSYSGGPYSAFGGRDASRGLATFSVVSSKDDYDDLSDLNTVEMESVREWEMQFTGEVFTKFL
jgi:hypothetical protein